MSFHLALTISFPTEDAGSIFRDSIFCLSPAIESVLSFIVKSLGNSHVLFERRVASPICSKWYILRSIANIFTGSLNLSLSRPPALRVNCMQEPSSTAFFAMILSRDVSRGLVASSTTDFSISSGVRNPSWRVAAFCANSRKPLLTNSLSNVSGFPSDCIPRSAMWTWG